jgi:hypothetical protein
MRVTKPFPAAGLHLDDYNGDSGYRLNSKFARASRLFSGLGIYLSFSMVLGPLYMHSVLHSKSISIKSGLWISSLVQIPGFIGFFPYTSMSPSLVQLR